MKLAALALASVSEALLGPARLELETSNTSGYTGFNGALKVYIGRNCVSNPSKGYICDFKYQMAVSGLQGGRIYEFDFPDQVDSRSDQILMTYRDQKEAMFSGMKLKVTPPGGGAAEIVDLKKLDGSTSNVSVFDYDSRDKPCGSSYPRNAVCRTDTMFDLYTGKEKPHYSLLSGHTVKFANYQNPVPMPYDATPYANSQLHFKTGGSVTAATDGELMIYYAKNCNSNVCTYTKELSVVLSSRSKSYDFYLPDFDYNKDQLIMDFRSDDAVELDEMSFTPCNGNSGCMTYNLLSFGTSSVYKAAFDYDGASRPCSGSYGSYRCMWEAVYDFKDKKLYMDRSVFKGQ